MVLPENLSHLPTLFKTFVDKLQLDIARFEFKDDISSEEIEIDDDIEVQIKADIISFTQNFFRLCNLAVLHGEYCEVENIHDFRGYLEKLVNDFTEGIKEIFILNIPKSY